VALPAAAIVAILLLAGSNVSAVADPDAAAEERRLYELALDRLLAGHARVMGIADRIRIAGAELCDRKIAPVIGVYAPTKGSFRDRWPRKDYTDPFVDAAVDRFTLGDEPRVLLVVPGLPADRAGLRPGDRITAVDGDPVRGIAIDLLHNRGESGRVVLAVDRDGEALELSIDAEMGCAIPSRFLPTPRVNAFAMSFGTQTGIYVLGGMSDLFDRDDDLATVVGHEFAHLVLGHTSYGPTSQRFESESDYLGLYFAARADYDVAGAPEVKNTFARNNPYTSVDWGFYSHPLTAERSLQLAAAVEEIARKRDAGSALDPDRERRKLVRPDVAPPDVDARLATLREESLVRLRSDIRRIQNVSHRLATAGGPACGEQVGPMLGATLARRHDFFRGKKHDIEAAFRVGDQATVLAVAPGSPAERAGLVQGDLVLEVDGSRVRRTQHVFERLRASESGDPVVLVQREARERELTLPREEGCFHGTFVSVSSSVDTSSHDNDEDMWIPTGLVRFARDDDELAIAISHQIGHQVIGTFRTAEDEPRADRIGLDIAARAGFDVRRATGFWERVAAEEFWKISADMGGTYIPHGALSRRMPVIREAALESATVAGETGVD